MTVRKVANFAKANLVLVFVFKSLQKLEHDHKSKGECLKTASCE